MASAAAWLAESVESSVTFITNATTFMRLHDCAKTILSKCDDDFVMPNGLDDPIKVWDDVNPLTNVWRFLLYIEWLCSQPWAFASFHRLCLERGDVLAECLTRLNDAIDGESKEGGNERSEQANDPSPV